MTTQKEFVGEPRVERLQNPVHCGDWHDKPLKWNVVWGSKNQMFATKKGALRYARIWKRNKSDELQSIKDYQTDPVPRKRVKSIARCPDCGKVISTRFPLHDCRKA